ncbi:hypothetical protein [Micromonospora sp. KC213]|uniref:hypothetical protein n=1 Tax=Micromonospora sp. KC213 TaxID=2530378 RepID=UPI0010443E65|nr:hypothetical protein [Micromonospora sp. KC213]TDC33466.1 hypothetical protein E1166_25695 [Micromonospora sp. KC213]
MAREIADMRRRLTALERTARLPRSSIDGGALTVTDTDGTPVLTVGAQDDGSYAVTGANGGQVVATALDLPAGSITETEIANDSISTPKLRANAVTTDKIEAGAITADKISADAIDGRTITGVEIVGGSITAGGAGQTVLLDDDGVGVTGSGGRYATLSQTALNLNAGNPDGHSFSNEAKLFAEIINSNGIDKAILRLISPSVDGWPAVPGSRISGVNLYGSDAAGGLPYVALIGDRTEVLGKLSVNGDATFANGKLGAQWPTAEVTSPVTPTSTTFVDLPGATIPVTTTRPGARYLALWTLDGDLTATGAATVPVRCMVGATALGRQAIINFSNVAVGARATPAQFMPGVLATAGDHVFKLQAARASGTGTVRINAVHTALTVIIFE